MIWQCCLDPGAYRTIYLYGAFGLGLLYSEHARVPRPGWICLSLSLSLSLSVNRLNPLNLDLQRVSVSGIVAPILATGYLGMYFIFGHRDPFSACFLSSSAMLAGETALSPETRRLYTKAPSNTVAHT